MSGLIGSYEEKLKQLEMYSLKDRRTRGDIIQTYEILHQIDVVVPSKFFSMSLTNHTYATHQAVNVSEDGFTTSPTWPLQKDQCRLALRANFFSQRVVNTWNSLPSSLQNSESGDAFKNKYDKLFLNAWNSRMEERTCYHYHIIATKTEQSGRQGLIKWGLMMTTLWFNCDLMSHLHVSANSSRIELFTGQEKWVNQNENIKILQCFTCTFTVI